MNPYVTGSTIKRLRENLKLTQAELADILLVSPKTISKWETGNGFPDVSILEDIASALQVSITELFSGDVLENTNQASNILKSKFYICPICGNVFCSMGEGYISCHGIDLKPLDAEEGIVFIEPVEDEIYVTIDSPMSKSNYISFIAGVYSDSIDFHKLYKEGSASTRLKVRGLRYIYYYDNRDGLFKYCYKRVKNGA